MCSSSFHSAADAALPLMQAAEDEEMLTAEGAAAGGAAGGCFVAMTSTSDIRTPQRQTAPRCTLWISQVMKSNVISSVRSEITGVYLLSGLLYFRRSSVWK